MPGVHGEGCGCKDEKELTGGENLLSYIDLDSVRCLNEQTSGACKNVLRQYSNRLDESFSLRSFDGDPELLMHIPFICPCKIGSLELIGGEKGRYPKLVKIYSNRDDLDFENINDVNAIQEIQLVEDFHGTVEYPLKVTKLSNVTNLVLYFPENNGADFTEIFYIGLRGQGTTHQRKAVITTYETQSSFAETDMAEDTLPPQIGF